MEVRRENGKEPRQQFINRLQSFKLNRIKSKDKIFLEQTRRKGVCKTPRAVRISSRNNRPKNVVKEKLNSDKAASKRIDFSTTVTKEDVSLKLKPSNIPQCKEVKDISSKKTLDQQRHGLNYTEFLADSQNVQRVQLFINPDFGQEDRSQATSITSTRPIPTLGQIYCQEDVINGNHLSESIPFEEWFMDLNAPTNSLASNPRSFHMRTSDENYVGLVSNSDTVNNPININERPIIVFDTINITQNSYKKSNDTICIENTLSIEAEDPTRDDEGYHRSLTPENHVAGNKSKHCDSSPNEKQPNENYFESFMTKVGSDKGRLPADPITECNQGSVSPPVKEQPTVVLRIAELLREKMIDIDSSKSNATTSTLKASDTTKPLDINEVLRVAEAVPNKAFQYSSLTHSVKNLDSNHNPVPSYVECSSEVLQKTTNFEGDGYESQKTLSSLTGTDLETRGELSSQCILEQTSFFGDEPSVTDLCNHQPCSQIKMDFMKSNATATESWLYRDKDDENSTDSSVDQYYYRWRKELNGKCYDNPHGESRERCRKCHRNKKFPSSRYKMPKKLTSWRRRISIRQICRHRWNNVWQKTAERWSTWSKSPVKLRKRRMMRYLQQPVIWEDANVQTNVLVYQETGTDTVKEQKSEAMSAIFSTGSWKSEYTKNETITNPSKSTLSNINQTIRSNKFKPRLRHVNLGPSMFPFVYNSKQTSLPLANISDKKPMRRFNSFSDNVKKIAIKKQSNSSEIDARSKDDISSPKEQCEDTTRTSTKISSMEESRDVTMASKNTDSEDLPFPLTINARTTMLYPMYWLSANEAKEACTQFTVAYHNAETEARVNVVPSVKNSSATSTGDIALYGLRGANAVTSCFERDQLQYSMFSKIKMLRSSFKSGSLKRVRANAESQVSPTQSEAKISTGVTTSSAPLFNQKASIVAGLFIDTAISQDIKQENKAVQTENYEPILSLSATKLISISSKEISEHPKINIHHIGTSVATIASNVRPMKMEVYHTEVGTDYLGPENVEQKLISTCSKGCDISELGTKYTTCGNNMVSISSQTIPERIDTFNTEMETEAPRSKSIECDTECCPPTFHETNTCGTEAKSLILRCSMSTSANGLEAEVEKIPHKPSRSNLKCASLVTSICGLPAPVQVSTTRAYTIQNLNSGFVQVSPPCQCASVMTSPCCECTSVQTTYTMDIMNESKTITTMLTRSTNTWVVMESKSIGEIPSESMKKSTLSKDKIDMEIQYSETEIPQNPSRSNLKCASLVTSICGLPAPVQVSTTSAYTIQNLNSGFVQVSPPCQCASVMTSPCCECTSVQTTYTMDIMNESKPSAKCTCAQMISDSQTNTEHEKPISLECLTQTSFYRNQKNEEVLACSPAALIVPNPRSKSQFQKKLSKQLTSLTRLIGKHKACSQIEKPVTVPIISRTDNGWIKKSYSMDEGYRKFPNLDPRDKLKGASLLMANITQSPISEFVKKSLPSDEILVSPLCLSEDSLADVLPVCSLGKNRSSNVQQINRIMVDEVTSDECITKDVKESILQACPENCDTETESVMIPTDLRSAGVFTSRCVLPLPSPCVHHLDGHYRPTDCLFVYGEPRCVVHKQSVNASVQLDSPVDEKESNAKKQADSINYSIGMQLTSCFDKPPSNHRQPAETDREVLPPKVYEALYASTKLESSDNSLLTVKDTGVGSFNAELETAVIKTPDTRSASIMTSQYRCGVTLGCCKEIATHTDCVFTYLANHIENTTQTPYHAKVLEMPREDTGSCLDECMKTHLVSSCRYYSNLLTKQFDRVKQNLTRSVPSTEKCMYEVAMFPAAEVSTMKPSGHEEFACQTCKFKSFYKAPKRISFCLLSPAVSLTNICQNDQPHLKSVYYTFMAIDGRLRRLNLTVPD